MNLRIRKRNFSQRKSFFPFFHKISSLVVEFPLITTRASYVSNEEKYFREHRS